jgi:hypothetical protein
MRLAAAPNLEHYVGSVSSIALEHKQRRAMMIRRFLAPLALGVIAAAGCSEEPPTEIVHGPDKVAVVYGRVTTETGEPLRAEHRVGVVPGTQDISCTGEIFTSGGTHDLPPDGRYRTVHGVPGFVPSRQCLKVIATSDINSPLRSDTVTVGIITLRYADAGVPLDSVRVDFVLKRKAQP